MKSVPYYSMGLPPAFNRVPTDPNYWVERYFYEQTMLAYNLMSQGITINQPETADYDDVRAAYDAFVAGFEGWATSAQEALDADLPVPAPPTLPVPIPGPGSEGEIIARLVLIAIKVLMKVLGRDSTADISKALLIDIGGQKRSILEVMGLKQDLIEGYVSRIGDVSASVDAVKDSLNVQVDGVDVPILKLMGLSNIGGAYQSLIEMMARTPIRITLETANTIEDVTLDEGGVI